jgi:hypothetical protein
MISVEGVKVAFPRRIRLGYRTYTFSGGARAA